MQQSRSEKSRHTNAQGNPFIQKLAHSKDEDSIPPSQLIVREQCNLQLMKSEGRKIKDAFKVTNSFRNESAKDMEEVTRVGAVKTCGRLKTMEMNC